MESLSKQTNKDAEQIDIFAGRVLAKLSSTEQIFFDSDSKGKVYVQICIHKKNESIKIKSLSDIKITNLSVEQYVICNYKVRVKIGFKVVLFIRYEDDSFEMVTLPDNCPSKFYFETSFPVNIENNELLEITDDNFFKWTADFPFNLFDALVSEKILGDPTAWLQTQVENTKTDFKFINGFTSSQNNADALIELAVFADIVNRLGIHQDILIQGIPVD